jgi:prepilin-type N-terminal cleavage/methylation domain-containing protein
MRYPSRRIKGFTLIELMVVVAIIAILTAIALPNYNDYVIRGNLVDGTNQLAAYRAQMEQYYQDARTYKSSGSAFTTPCPSSLTVGKWTYDCPTATLTGSTYTITATGSGPARNFKYSIDQTNAQVSVSLPSLAWGVNGTLHWVMKKGG